MKKMGAILEEVTHIPVRGDVKLEGKLRVEEGSTGIVVFSHGSKRSRKSPRNNFVADVLTDNRISTLLFVKIVLTFPC